MKYLLDSDTCIGLLRRPQEAKSATRLLATSSNDVVLCSIVKAELIYGARRSQRAIAELALVDAFFARFSSLPFGYSEATVYGQIREALASHGTPIGPNDLLIAAIALANGLTLVTHNTREFSRVAGLSIEDWQA